MSRKFVGGAVLLMALGTALIGAALVRPVSALQGRQVEPEARQHVPIGEPIVYRNRPPSSGAHYERTLRFGVYEREIEPGYWVHNLEHGGVVLLYNCAERCDGLVEQLRQVYTSAPRSQKYNVVKLAAVPYRDMDHILAAVAWGVIDEMDEFDRDRILAFYREHLDHGPEDAL